jgi:hypothetical protein
VRDNQGPFEVSKQAAPQEVCFIIPNVLTSYASPPKDFKLYGVHLAPAQSMLHLSIPLVAILVKKYAGFFFCKLQFSLVTAL